MKILCSWLCLSVSLMLLRCQATDDSDDVSAAGLINVYSMNILAPSWAWPEWYPDDCVEKLPISLRTPGWDSFLQSKKEDADIFAFQEVQVSTSPYLIDFLGESDYHYFVAYDDDEYWEKWIVDDPPWESNGNSIAINKNKYDTCYFEEVVMNGGNHGAFALCHNIFYDHWFRISSVNFDYDIGGRRKKECVDLREYYDNWVNTYDIPEIDENYKFIDIIAGDFNADTNRSHIHKELIKSGNFEDIFKSVGIYEMTHPWTTSLNRSPNRGPIDHVIVRSETLAQKELSEDSDGDDDDDNAVLSESVEEFNVIASDECNIFDGGLWDLYPWDGNSNPDQNDVDRICATLTIFGTDHFYVRGSFTLEPK